MILYCIYASCIHYDLSFNREIIKIKSSSFGKQSIFKDKYLYLDLISTFGLILIGLLMSMAIFYQVIYILQIKLRVLVLKKPYGNMLHLII